MYGVRTENKELNYICKRPCIVSEITPQGTIRIKTSEYVSKVMNDTNESIAPIRYPIVVSIYYLILHGVHWDKPILLKKIISQGYQQQEHRCA